MSVVVPAVREKERVDRMNLLANKLLLLRWIDRFVDLIGRAEQGHRRITVAGLGDFPFRRVFDPRCRLSVYHFDVFLWGWRVARWTRIWRDIISMTESSFEYTHLESRSGC